MLKKYEVETMIRNALLETDGIISDKPDQDGNYEMYFADVSEDDNDNIVLTFDTYVGNEKIETDRYKIKIEYMQDTDDTEDVIRKEIEKYTAMGSMAQVEALYSRLYGDY
jgi:hypothetical protein